MATTAPYPAPRVLADVLPKTWARDILLVVGGAGFVGLAAQIAFVIPTISPVAFTMQTFAVLLTGAALGTKRGAAALMLYALLGLVGVPWYAQANSAFAGGTLTPTFGYIVGFILAAALVGYLADRGWSRSVVDTALAMLAGSIVIYAVGVPWLHFATGAPWSETIYRGMTVFLVSDALKIAAAAGLFPLIWRQLSKAGLAPRDDETTLDLEAAEEGTNDLATATATDEPAKAIDPTDTEVSNPEADPRI